MALVKHLNRLGLINFLFYPGSSGSFLANMISKALLDPYYDSYIPKCPDKNYYAVNEYNNPYMHIGGIWHPYMLIDSSPFCNTKWVVINITIQQYYFSSVINSVKCIHKNSLTFSQAIEAVKSEIYLPDLDNRYKKYNNDLIRICDQLSINNIVTTIEFTDLFEKGSVNSVQNIMDLMYSGFYSNNKIVSNIAKQCLYKHNIDLNLYSNIIDDPIAIVKHVFTVMNNDKN